MASVVRPNDLMGAHFQVPRYDQESWSPGLGSVREIEKHVTLISSFRLKCASNKQKILQPHHRTDDTINSVKKQLIKQITTIKTNEMEILSRDSPFQWRRIFQIDLKLNLHNSLQRIGLADGRWKETIACEQASKLAN